MRQHGSAGTLNPYPLSGSEVVQEDNIGLKIILHAYHFPFFAAYRGLTDWSDEYVASNGDKLREAECAAIFGAVYTGMLAMGWRYNR